MLHWLFIFSYILIILALSLIFLNKSLLTTLMISEVMLLFFFLLGLLVGSLTNIYYILVFGFFILVLGGLELALNILLFLL